MPSQNLASGDVLVPRPDPTKLTTDAVRAARVEIEKLFDAKLTAIHDLMDEKFTGVASDFIQRDTALKAAFKAAQDAVTQQASASNIAAEKLAASFTKQIDSLDEKIDDLKDRIQDNASRLNANASHSTGIRDMVGWVFGALGFLVAAGTMVATALRHS